MKVPLSLRIALRFSRGQRRNSVVSLNSFISTIGIALGVAVLIIGLSAMNGFERELNNRILAVIPHGEIEPVNSSFANWQEILKRIEQLPAILAAAPYLNFTGLIERGDKIQAIQIKGVDPELEMRLSTAPSYVQGNAWSFFHAGQQQIIVGKGVAEALKVKVGDWLTIIIQNNNSSKVKPLQLKRIRLRVSGIFVLNGQLDHSFAMVPLVDAQHYLSRGKNVDGIAIKVGDVFNANNLVRNAGKVTNTYVKIRSWIGSYGYIYRDIQIIRTIMCLAMILVIGVACFSIASILVIAVKDKSSDIAILRTLGAKNLFIRAIFIWYGLLAGITGSVLGVWIGVLTSLNLTTLMKRLERLLDCRLLSSDIYFIDFFPTELHWIDVIIVLTTALLLSLLASWYPALRASRSDIAKALSRQ